VGRLPPRDGQRPIDIDAALLPESGIPGTMAFVGRHSVPDLATVTRRLTRAESRLEGEEIVAGLVSSVVESGAVRSEGVRDEGGARGRRRCP
jgi:hypothetical protein